MITGMMSQSIHHRINSIISVKIHSILKSPREPRKWKIITKGGNTLQKSIDFYFIICSKSIV